MNWREYITSDPEIMFGKPSIINTRIPVDLILEKLGTGETIDQLLKSYPGLNETSIHACLMYASESLKSEIIKRAS